MKRILAVMVLSFGLSACGITKAQIKANVDLANLQLQQVQNIDCQAKCEEYKGYVGSVQHILSFLSDKLK